MRRTDVRFGLLNASEQNRLEKRIATAVLSAQNLGIDIRHEDEHLNILYQKKQI